MDLEGRQNRFILRIRAYHATRRGLLHSSQLGGVINQGLWLGLIDGENLDKSTALFYRGQEKYCADSYNLQGLLGWEADAFDRYFCGCESVLVAAAGGGREALALAKKGWDVLGFDCDETMVARAVALASSQSLEARFVHAPPSAVPEVGRTFDAVLVGWGGYMHIAGSNARIAFLHDLRQCVRLGAPLLLSFFTRAESARRFSYIQRLASGIRRMRGSHEAVEIGDTLDGSFDHYFTRAEVFAELDAADFRAVAFEEDRYGHAVATAA